MTNKKRFIRLATDGSAYIWALAMTMLGRSSLPSPNGSAIVQYVPLTANVHDVPTISWRVIATGPLANRCMLI